MNRDQINVPGDENCLFYSVTLALLLQFRDDVRHGHYQNFIHYAQSLFLGADPHDINMLKLCLFTPQDPLSSENFLKLLQKLVNNNLRPKLVEYMREHEQYYKKFWRNANINYDDHVELIGHPQYIQYDSLDTRDSTAWGTELEILALANMLGVSIRVKDNSALSVNPDHSTAVIYIVSTGDNRYHFLTEPDNDNKELARILCSAPPQVPLSESFSPALEQTISPDLKHDKGEIGEPIREAAKNVSIAPERKYSMSRDKINVPGDGNCLFYSVTLALLLQFRDQVVVDDYADNFNFYARKLFGNNDRADIRDLREALLPNRSSPDPGFVKLLTRLVNEKLRPKLAQYMRMNRQYSALALAADPKWNIEAPDRWADHVDIKALAHMLGITIEIVGVESLVPDTSTAVVSIIHTGGNHYQFFTQKHPDNENLRKILRPDDFPAESSKQKLPELESVKSEIAEPTQKAEHQFNLARKWGLVAAGKERVEENEEAINEPVEATHQHRLFRGSQSEHNSVVSTPSKTS